LLFCREHRWQPFAWTLSLLTVVGLFAGLYQDLWKPVRQWRTGEMKATQPVRSDQDQGVSQVVPSSIPPTAASPDLGQFIGMRHDGSPPEGYTELAGSMLPDADGREYALAHVLGAGMNMVWLEKLAYRDEQGGPHWEVRAAISIPPVGSDEALVLGGWCEASGRADRGVFALVGADTYDDWFTEVRRAWRVDVARESIEAISTEDVRCENEFSGI
jgi:hypothetical protein